MGHESPRDRIRWFTVRNCGTRTIPGFGLCSTKLADALNDGPGCQEVVEGQVAWRVYSPLETEAYALQDPTMLWVNGPTAIEPGKYGKASQDWPLQVLAGASGSSQELRPGYECGPANPDGDATITEGWMVGNEGNAFVCVADDAAKAVRKKGVRTVWIAPSTRRLLPVFGQATFSGTYLQEAAALSFGAFDPRGVTVETSSLVMDTDALLWVAVSGTLTSANAVEGSPLGMVITLDDEDTAIYGYRSFEIDTDYPSTTYRTNENVAVAGMIGVRKGQRLKVVVGLANTYQTTVSRGLFAFHRIYQPYDPTTAPIPYGS